MFHLSSYMLIFHLLWLGLASAAAPKCNADDCARQITGTYKGLPQSASRRLDCSSFFKTTVYPATFTQTVYQTVYPTTTTKTVITSTSLQTETTYPVTTTAFLTFSTDTSTYVSTYLTTITQEVDGKLSFICCSSFLRCCSQSGCLQVHRTFIWQSFADIRIQKHHSRQRQAPKSILHSQQVQKLL